MTAILTREREARIGTMSKREKLRRKLRNNPKSATKQDIETLLGYFGFILDRITGSHHIYIVRIGKLVYRIVVPVHGRKIKTAYAKQVLDLLDEIFPEESEVEGEGDE